MGATVDSKDTKATSRMDMVALYLYTYKKSIWLYLEGPTKVFMMSLGSPQH